MQNLKIKIQNSGKHSVLGLSNNAATHLHAGKAGIHSLIEETTQITTQNKHRKNQKSIQ